MEETLAAKTLAFWRISILVNAGVGKQMTVQDAIQGCTSTIAKLGPQRQLRSRLQTLSMRLIIGGRPRKAKTRRPSNIIKLSAKA